MGTHRWDALRGRRSREQHGTSKVEDAENHHSSDEHEGVLGDTYRQSRERYNGIFRVVAGLVNLSLAAA